MKRTADEEAGAGEVPVDRGNRACAGGHQNQLRQTAKARGCALNVKVNGA
jgi:hypothetical protein